MLSIKQNFLETIHGGSPDRYVNQYEYMANIPHPILLANVPAGPGDLNVVNAWGYTLTWPEGQMGAFPVHTPERIVVKDIVHWRDYVKAPKVKYSETEWEPFVAMAEAVDRTEKFVAPVMAPGIFEIAHHLCEISETLVNLYEEPESMKDLFKYLAEWEVQVAEEVIAHLKPDALFHHDDWGSKTSTFMSPAMFDEFLLEPYKEVYGFWKSNGVEIITHHSDSYCETIVPEMIEMGIDVWQGALNTNDIPALARKYGDKITFMGGIDSILDRPDWNREEIFEEVHRACAWAGKRAFIPSLTFGMDASSFPGVYDTVTEAIDECSREFF